MTFKELREASGMNKTDFGKYFGIPFRTIQNWEGGLRKCPDYLLELMKYKLEKEGFLEVITEEVLIEKINAMDHVMTYDDEYISIYKDAISGEQYLITTDDNDKIYYICKVLN